jgi:hypothetical protein
MLRDTGMGYRNLHLYLSAKNVAIFVNKWYIISDFKNQITG